MRVRAMEFRRPKGVRKEMDEPRYEVSRCVCDYCNHHQPEDSERSGTAGNLRSDSRRHTGKRNERGGLHQPVRGKAIVGVTLD